MASGWRKVGETSDGVAVWVGDGQDGEPVIKVRQEVAGDDMPVLPVVLMGSERKELIDLLMSVA